MRYGELRRLAAQSGALALLDRVGLRGPIGDLARLVATASERERWRIIRQDFEACRAQIERIARGAPAGDPARTAWVVCSMPTVWGVKMDGVLSWALRLGDFSPVGVHLGHNTWSRRYYRLFGIERALDFPRSLSRLPRAVPAPEIVDFVRSRPTVRDLLGLAYRQVDIGRVALSNVLNRRKFSKFDLAEPATLAEVESELIQAQRNVLAAERIVDEHRPAVAMLLEKGLSPMAEVFGVCVARGIPVVQYVGAQTRSAYVLKRYTRENRHQHPFSLDPATWAAIRSMPWDPADEAAVMRDFEESYRSGTWFDRKFLHHGKQIKPPDAVRAQLGLDPARKTAVVFSHVLWDATFFYGDGLFDDYETWLLETVRAACANPRVNWVVKLHPDLVWKLKYEGYAGELRDVLAMRSAVGSLPPHVKLVLPDTDISTYSFFAIADCCVTVRGTVGIEMACHGVPVLTAGTGRYSGLGFTMDSDSAAEYLGRLATLESLPPMSREQVELARRFAHALFKRRPWPVRTFELVRMPPDRAGHPLDANVLVHAQTFEEFASASDMQEFADWIASGQIDYLQAAIGVAGAER